ncbi:putative short-chain dehydrogenase [Leptodontidium sp. 2 PMI_412]|nr:putative short-chain dehydrogenase [Leptodontidium sp. 2 PMI_412]
MPFLPLFIQRFRTLHLPPPDSFASQTVIITGANTGLGLETARHIVSLGASKVILGVRTLSKGVAAQSDIEATTGRTGVIEVWEIDLESFASVKAFTRRAASLERLDVAIMNAGLASSQWHISDEGFERQIQVNVLSTALLMLLLIPILVRSRREHPSSKPHLTVLGIDSHMDAKFEERHSENILETLNDKIMWEETSSNPAERYSVSKLLVQYVVDAVARLTPKIGGEPAVIVDIVAPGFCKSNLREDGDVFILKVLQFLMGRTNAERAKCVVDGAIRGPEAHGQYLDHQKIASVGTLVRSEEGSKLQEKIWEEILEVLLPVAPEIECTIYGDV